MMHKKRINLFIIILTGIIFLTIGAITATDLPTEAPDDVIIENTGYKKDKKKPVPEHILRRIVERDVHPHQMNSFFESVVKSQETARVELNKEWAYLPTYAKDEYEQ